MVKSSDQAIDRAARLYRFLAEAQRPRIPAAAAPGHDDRVLWLGRLPTDATVANAVYGAAEDDSWLVMDRIEHTPTPAPPEGLARWLDLDDLEDWRGAPPSLLDKDRTGPAWVHHQYGTWCADWTSWAAEQRSRAATVAAYRELYAIHQDAHTLSEQNELVLAVGYLTGMSGNQHIRRHLVTTPASINLDIRTGRLRVGPADGGTRLSLEEVSDGSAIPAQKKGEVSVAELLVLAGNDPFNDDVYVALETWAYRHGALTKYLRQSIPHQDKRGKLQISHAPALILRKRTRRAYVDAFTTLEKAVRNKRYVPELLRELVIGRTESAQTENPPEKGMVSSVTYFPAPYNREQRQIKEQLCQDRTVVVQGPPGTGKTHTIANLVTDLLAHGNRVLVTSPTSRALDGLHDKLPEQIQDLCVSMVSSDGQGRKGLEQSVRALLDGLHRYDEGAALEQSNRLKQRLVAARRARAETSRQLRNAGEQSTSPNDKHHAPNRTAQAERDEHDALCELITHLAWDSCLRRAVHGADRLYLNSYVQAVKRIGKGTDKYVHRYRAEARERLNKCQHAVPAWIMPLHHVVDVIPMDTPDLFDVAIIDEAGQAGPEALLLPWLARRIVVMGDDQQVGPPEVSNGRGKIRRLVDAHIPDLPVRTLLQSGSSFLDLAMASHSAVTLREHFRCMPEIIAFSNLECYAGDLRPLRQYGQDRLDPLRHSYVDNAVVTAEKGGISNEVEADALVDQVVRCCADPAYAGRRMGIIALECGAQEKLIEDRLMTRLSITEMQERRLRVGTPESFQGTERDVVFLSMVVAVDGGGRSAETFEDARRRYNVAASRARDQVWLFHSVHLDDLSPEDLRYRYLEFASGPLAEHGRTQHDTKSPVARPLTQTSPPPATQGSTAPVSTGPARRVPEKQRLVTRTTSHVTSKSHPVQPAGKTDAVRRTKHSGKSGGSGALVLPAGAYHRLQQERKLLRAKLARRPSARSAADQAAVQAQQHDYEVRRQRLTSRLAQLDLLLSNAVMGKRKGGSQETYPGCVIVVCDDGSREPYAVTIAEAAGADAKYEAVRPDSEMGKALAHAVPGCSITFQAPSGPRVVHVLEIRAYPPQN